MQKSYRQLLLAFAAAMALQFGLTPVAQGDLIGYWPFDEEVEVDGDRYTPDASPTEGPHNGLLVGDAVIVEDPDRGGVLDLGDFNNGAGVSVPTFPQNEETEIGVIEDAGPGFSAIVASQETTISFWFNRRGDDPTNQWTFLFNAPAGRQLGSHAPWSDGNVYFDVSGCCGGNQRISTSLGTAATDAGWHHMAYVKKVNTAEEVTADTTALTAVFLDGTAIVASPGCDVNCWNSGATDDLIDWDSATISNVVPIDAVGIGAQASGADSNNGFMDDFAIWDNALSVERIVGLSQGGGVIPIPEGETLGDFNSDGAINADDFGIMAENFNQAFGLDEAFFKGDMDGNLRVNLKDFLAFRGLVDAPAAAAASSVPEPSTGLLMAFACLGMLSLRRKNH